MKKLNYLFWAGIVLVGFFLIFSLVPGCPYRLLVITSGSMEPTIKRASVVVILPTKAYQPGQVITFRHPQKPERFITHRINDLEVIEGKVFYLTKGDANNIKDQQKVSQDEVVGKALFWIPYLGYIIEITRRPIGFAILLLIPVSIIVYSRLFCGKRLF